MNWHQLSHSYRYERIVIFHVSFLDNNYRDITVKTKRMDIQQPRLGLRPCSSSTNVPTATSLTTLTVVCWISSAFLMA